MRDLDKMREKTVLALDGRQLFFLFFGGSVAAALLFALGVIVGRKLPSAEAAVEDDPLAMLDQLGADEDLSFQKGLKGRAAPPAPRPAPEPEAPAPQPPAPPPAATPAPAVPPDPPAKTMEPAAAKPKARTLRPAPAATTVTPVEDSASGRFTLQLSSFQEKGEAAEFMKALQDKGYQTYVVSAEVPGRGLWYRVRLGDYPSHGDALEAKAEFERKQRIIAYVLRR